MSTKDDKLLKLLEQKAFAALSNEERAFVLDYVSEHEYELQREVFNMGAELIEEESAFLSPDPRISSNLREALAGREQRNSIWKRVSDLMLKPIPAYQMAAVLVALLVLFVWKSNTHPTDVVYKEKIVYLEKHDTVYVEKPLLEIQTVEKIVKVVEYVVQSQEIPSGHNNEPYISEKERMEEAAAKRNAFAFTDEQIEKQKEKSFGNSSMDTRELAKLIGVID